MKIVHLLRYYAPAWGYGGVVRAVYGLASAQAAQGHTVSVVTTDAGDDGGRLPAGEAFLAGVRVLRCPNRFPALLRYNLSSPQGMRTALRAELPDADILHIHELRTVEALLGLPLARQGKVPVVLSPHGTLSYNAGRGSMKRVWDMAVGRRSIRQIGQVAALTADEAEDVRGLWRQLGTALPEGRLSVVPNGVDPGEFAAEPVPGVFRARWDIPADVPLILFLGRLHARKGVHYLIDALVHLPDAWLAVVGPDEGQGAALRDRAVRLGVDGQVVFTNLLTGTDKLAALYDADVLALPAVGEGLPMVALEAMMAGLPVALSEGCHLPEAISAGAGVALDVLDEAVIAAALQPLLADAALRQTMGERGRQLVLSHFTWDAVVAEMLQVYRASQIP